MDKEDRYVTPKLEDYKELIITEGQTAEIKKENFNRALEIEIVMNNIKKAWLTKPELEFGQLLQIISENTNQNIYQLTDENIKILTDNLDLNNYQSSQNLKKWVDGLTIGTVYDDGGKFAGYDIVDKDVVQLIEPDFEKMLDEMDLVSEDVVDMLSNFLHYIDTKTKNIIFYTMEDAKKAVKHLKEELEEIINDME